MKANRQHKKNGFVQRKKRGLFHQEEPSPFFGQQPSFFSPINIQAKSESAIGSKTQAPAIQKDDDEEIPPVPDVRLNVPPLRYPGPGEASLGGFAGRLRLDPSLRMNFVRQRLNLLDPDLIAAVFRQHLARQFQLSPTPTQNSLGGNSNPAATSTSNTQTAPPLNFPLRTRQATTGDLLNALSQERHIRPLVEGVKSRVNEEIESTWDSMGEGVQEAFLGVGITLGVAGTLSMYDPNVRRSVMTAMDTITVGSVSPVDLINGTVIPISVGGMRVGLEYNLQPEGNHYMFGIHLDAGSLLPKWMGFGPASFQSLAEPMRPLDTAMPGR